MVAANLLGKKFGRLAPSHVVYKENAKGKKERFWFCDCDCGGTSLVKAADLNRGQSTSCGCKHKEHASMMNRTHGMAGTKVYQCWKGMKSRCYNPKEKQYKDYGGRGITVCDRWLNSFDAFLADMGEPPTQKHSIDRIDVNKSYEPGNCRWATSLEQNRNRTDNVLYEYQGKSYHLIELSEKFGISFSTLAGRLITRCWPVAKAIETPVAEYKKDPTYVWGGVTKTVGSLAKEYGIDYQVVRARLSRGWGIERALSEPVRQAESMKLYEFNGQSRTLTEWGDVSGIGLSTLHARIRRHGWCIEKALTTPVRGRPEAVLEVSE